MAGKDIPAGAWVHSHNLGSGLQGIRSYEPSAPFTWAGRGAALDLLARSGLPATFMGYRRPGAVGIRNEVWVIPTVGCVNRTAEVVAELGRKEFGLDAFAFGHPYGCSQLGGDLDATRTILARLTQHPNAAGAIVLSLGCESNTLAAFKAELGEVGDRVHFIPLQQTDDEVEAAQAALASLSRMIEAEARVPLPLAELTIGLKCGGSDAFPASPPTPWSGRVCDCWRPRGGSALMTEVPEMFGAETN